MLTNSEILEQAQILLKLGIDKEKIKRYIEINLRMSMPLKVVD